MGTSADKVYKVRADDVHLTQPDDNTRRTSSAYSSRRKGGKKPQAVPKQRWEQSSELFFLSHSLAISYVFFFSVSSSYQLLPSALKQHLCLEETYLWTLVENVVWWGYTTGMFDFFFFSQSRRLDGNISRNAFLFVFTSRVTPSHQCKSVDHFWYTLFFFVNSCICTHCC